MRPFGSDEEHGSAATGKGSTPAGNGAGLDHTRRATSTMRVTMEATFMAKSDQKPRSQTRHFAVAYLPDFVPDAEGTQQGSRAKRSVSSSRSDLVRPTGRAECTLTPVSGCECRPLR